MGALDILPVELLTHVLSELDVRSILACKQVSQRLKHIIDTSVLLRYLITLELYGYEDYNLNRGRLSTNERLQTLESHVSAWRRLQWTLTLSLVLPKSTGLDMFQGVLVCITMDDNVTVYELPSSFRDRATLQSWSYPLFPLGNSSPVHYRASIHLPERDLLIVVGDRRQEVRWVPTMYVRSLSTGHNHPQATRLEFPLENNGHLDRLVLMDDVVGLLYYPVHNRPDLQNIHPPRVVLVNWRTGKMIANAIIPSPFPSDVSSSMNGQGVTFIGPNLIIIATGSIHIRLYEITSDANCNTQLVLVTTYGLFPNADHVIDNVLDIEGNEWPRSTSSISRVGVPFTRKPSEAVVCVRYATQAGPLTLIVPTRIFQSQWLTTHQQSNPVVPIPWNEWAPHVRLALNRDPWNNHLGHYLCIGPDRWTVELTDVGGYHPKMSTEAIESINVLEGAVPSDGPYHVVGRQFEHEGLPPSWVICDDEHILIEQSTNEDELECFVNILTIG